MKTAVLDRVCLEQIFERISGVNALLVGDICVDAYWYADMLRSTLSRETPHFNLPVTRERYVLGAGGNVLNNMAALRPKEVCPLTVIGADWRSELALKLIAQTGASDRFVIRDEKRVTPAYCKPMKMGYAGVLSEDPRVDFENSEPLLESTQNALLDALDRAAKWADVIAVSDQFNFGVVTPGLRKALAETGARGKLIIVDSRDRAGLFKNVMLKPNELESAAITGIQPESVTPEAYLPVARAVSRLGGRGAVVTLGAQGAVCAGGDGECAFAPACALEPPFDIVGAGDTFLSALSLSLAAGAGLDKAAMAGNLASGVTVKKLNQTGTASREEMLSLYDKMLKGDVTA